MSDSDDNDFTGMYDVLEALEAVIASSDPERREQLAAAIDGYMNSCPEDFFWSVGAQAPSLLYHLVTSIDMSCRPESQSKPRPPIPP